MHAQRVRVALDTVRVCDMPRAEWGTLQDILTILQALEDLAAVLHNSSSTSEQRQLALQNFGGLFL